MAKAIDLSKHMITHMNHELTADARDVEHLNLDQNSISKLENISHLVNLQQLSAGHNCLIKISGLEAIHNLTVLNLPENSICSIDGISHLTQLTWLNLSGNNIRDITGLCNNVALRHIDLSDNTITALADISNLYALKALLLHGNIIREVNDSNRFLPKNITILSLAENEITELVQVKNLSGLKKLTQLSLMNNPCISYHQLNHHSLSYRSYVLSWLTCLEVLDGQHVAAICRQNASQFLAEGVVRTFTSSEQAKLVHYLSQVALTSSHNSSQSSKGRPVTTGGGDRRPPVTTQSGMEGSSSPLVSRRDMKGLIRQVIGQERSPGPSVTAVPTLSAALPKMSRSRSGSCSPARDRTSANRKLLLQSSDEQPIQYVPHTAPADIPSNTSKPATFHTPTSKATHDQFPVYTHVHHTAATTIQSLWRGYFIRNIHPGVQKVKQEIRSRRLEDTLSFLIGEMNRQQAINMEGQNIRASLLAGIERLSRKIDELPSNQYSDVSAV